MEAVMDVANPTAKPVPARSPGSPGRVAALAAVLAWAVLQAPLSGCASRPSVVGSLMPPQADAAEALGPDVICEPEKHEVLLCWIAGDSSGWRVWFSRSADRGATWSKPVAVTGAAAALRLEPESSPRMVSDEDGRVGIAWSVWAASAAGAPRTSDLCFAQSLDGGARWSAPVTVNDDTSGGAGSQSFHDLALRPGGTLFAAWVDSRPGADSLSPDGSEGGDPAIWFARSEDFGAHWGPNAAHWSHACPNSRVSLAVDPAGALYATFRKRYAGEVRDVVIGRTGGPPIRIAQDLWKTAENPAAGPAIAVSRDATLRLAWYTGAPDRAGVWFQESMPELVDSTRTPVLVLRSDRLQAVHVGIAEAGMSGTLLACDADSTGANQLTLARVEPSGRRVVERFVVPGTRGASYPNIAIARAGRTAYVVWTQHDAGHSNLRLLRWDVGR